MSNKDFQSQYEEAMSKFNTKPGTKARPTTAAATNAPPKVYFKDRGDTIPADWQPFSMVFGFPAPSGADRSGPVYERDAWPESLKPFIPEVDKHYELQPELVEALWNAHIDNDVVFLHGQSGTGKSSLEEQFAAYLNQPFLRFNGREDTESSALFGQLTVEGDGTVWKDGLLTEGVRYGARVLMDEATVIPAGIWMGLQWVLERGGKLMLTDKPAEAGERLVQPDPRFRLTLADNTKGQGDELGMFNGTGILNTATLNRIGTTMEVKFLDHNAEVALLTRKFGYIDTEILEDTVRMAGMLRAMSAKADLSLSFSPRSIHNMLTKAYNYRDMPVIEALRRGFNEGWANLLPTDEEYGAASNTFQMVFGGYA